MAKEYFFITKFHFFTIKYDISHKKSDKRSHFLKKFCFCAVNRTFAEGLIEIFRPQKRERHLLFHVKKQFTGGVFLSKKPASSLMEKGGIGLCRHSISATSLSIRERDWTRCSLRFRPISSLMEKEGLDDSVTSFPSPPFGLRPEAVILDRAVFASLSRGQSNPRRGFSSPVF